MSSNFQDRASAWTGWVIFAGVVMFTIGCLNVIQGFVALFKDDVYLVTENGLIATTNYSYWGWALLLVANAEGAGDQMFVTVLAPLDAEAVVELECLARLATDLDVQYAA